MENIDFMRFIENLKYMGMGMFGIIAVIGILILITTILSKVTSPKNEK